LAYRPPLLLQSEHHLDGFECRSQEQTEWLGRDALQSSSAGTTRVLVVSPTSSNTVIAYYGWCMASIALDDTPPRARKGAGSYPQSVALLARLGVGVLHEGRGIGAGLLQDMIARTLAVGDKIRGRGLLVHAETLDSASFYRHLVPEFECLPPTTST
jgi:hypothetical protein